jgi:hypothetical protein
LLLVSASTPAGVVADSPVVIPDLSVLGEEEGAVVVAEVSDRRPATLAEEGPSTSTVVVPNASAAGGLDALVEGRAETWPVLGSSGLIPAQLNPSEWGGQPLLFWSRATSDSEPLLSLNDDLEERSRDSFREYTEVAMRSLRSAMEILSRDVPRVFQVRI